MTKKFILREISQLEEGVFYYWNDGDTSELFTICEKYTRIICQSGEQRIESKDLNINEEIQVATPSQIKRFFKAREDFI